MAERACQRLAMHAAMAQALAGEETAAAIAAAAGDLTARFAAGGTLLIFGNGGSAADAQHLAAEFTGRYLLDRAPLPALALADNTAAARRSRSPPAARRRTCWRGCGLRASWGCSRSE